MYVYELAIPYQNLLVSNATLCHVLAYKERVC